MFQLKTQGTPELVSVAERVTKLEAEMKQCLIKLEAFQKAQSDRIFSMGGYTTTRVSVSLRYDSVNLHLCFHHLIVNFTRGMSCSCFSHVYLFLVSSQQVLCLVSSRYYFSGIELVKE